MPTNIGLENDQCGTRILWYRFMVALTGEAVHNCVRAQFEGCPENPLLYSVRVRELGRVIAISMFTELHHMSSKSRDRDTKNADTNKW